MNAQQQKGVALIMALLVVSIATTAAVAISENMQREIRRTGNMISYEQAVLYVTAAEDFARYGLKLDHDNNKTDDLNELWHTVPVAEEIPGGTLAGKLDELQGRFNLNNLANKQDIDKQRFKRLLTILDIPSEQHEALTAALIDWLDADRTTDSPWGAEDDYYMGLAEPGKPYLAANQLFAHLSEIYLVKGFDYETIEKLRINYLTHAETGDEVAPLFSVLPEYTLINVNTAPAEVLRSLDEAITEEIATTMIEHRDGNIKNEGEATPFKSVDEFIQYCEKQGIKNLKKDGLSVASHYFVLRTYIDIDRASLNALSIIKRNDKGTGQVIARYQGSY